MSPISPTEDATAPRRRRTRRGRFLAGTVAASLTVAGVAIVNSQSASAAGTDRDRPNAQSVGNFVDATLGGKPLDSVAKLKYATAQAPGSTSVQNPLDVELLKAIDLPLTGALQLPTLLGIHLGAVTQKAYANVDGYSYGQAGLLLNSGGVSVGGNNNAADMAGNATIDLSASGLPAAPARFPVAARPTRSAASRLNARRRLCRRDHAPSSTARANDGVDRLPDRQPEARAPKLAAARPAARLALSQVTGLSPVNTAARQGGTQQRRSVTSARVACRHAHLDNGAVVLDPANAAITDRHRSAAEDAAPGPEQPPAEHRPDRLRAELPDQRERSRGGHHRSRQRHHRPAAEMPRHEFSNDIPGLGPVLGSALIDTLTQGQATLEKTINGLISQPVRRRRHQPAGPLADTLEKLVDIGVNVQPNGPAGPSGHAYTDHLAATAKQGTPVVAGQTVERAMEVNVLTGRTAPRPRETAAC